MWTLLEVSYHSEVLMRRMLGFHRQPMDNGQEGPRCSATTDDGDSSLFSPGNGGDSSMFSPGNDGDSSLF